MPNIGLGLFYSVLLLKITGNLSMTTEFHYYFHDRDMTIINTTDRSQFIGQDIRDLYIDLLYNSYVEKVTVEFTCGLSHFNVLSFKSFISLFIYLSIY